MTSPSFPAEAAAAAADGVILTRPTRLQSLGHWASVEAGEVLSGPVSGGLLHSTPPSWTDRDLEAAVAVRGLALKRSFLLLEPLLSALSLTSPRSVEGDRLPLDFEVLQSGAVGGVAGEELAAFLEREAPPTMLLAVLVVLAFPLAPAGMLALDVESCALRLASDLFRPCSACVQLVTEEGEEGEVLLERALVEPM